MNPDPVSEPRKLRVFLCHASQDKPIVRELYQRLLAEGWIDPWLDEEKLLPGQDWDLEIEKAVEAADAVIVYVSSRSVTKEGYVQKEIRKVLDIALEKPEETIFIIPLRLDDCELPRRLRTWQYVDYFPAEGRKRAYERLLQSLDIRLSQSWPKEVSSEEVPPDTVEYSAKPVNEKGPAGKNIFHRVIDSVKSKGSGEVDVGGSVIQILYFSLAGLDGLGDSDDTVKMLLGIFAILAGIVLLIKKQIPATILYKISTIAYLLLYGLGWRIEDLIPFAPYLVGVAALISGGVLVLTVRTPKKPVFFSSISFALFLFFVGIYVIVTSFNYYPPVINDVGTLIMITGIVTSVLMLRDL
jgi:hypothetical protein